MALAIAIDAMGGDQAPGEVIRGTIEAAKLHPDLRLLLVGRGDVVRGELDGLGASLSNVEIVHADHAIGMGEGPVEALRRKKGSSIEVAARLVRSGEAAALVSAGNTGACVAAGTILLGLLPRVRRAGIAVCLQAGSGSIILIDVGANISSKPEHLIQYGIMASLYARCVLRLDEPRVGLLNIGEENEKGTSLVRSTHALFRETELNFVGNVEGVEIFRGVCDVIVCDGFVGNIVLKVSEGLAEQLLEQFRAAAESALRALPARVPSPVEAGLATAGSARGGPSTGGRGLADIGASGLASSPGGGDVGGPDPVGFGLLERKLRASLSSLRERIDYSEYGGAPLLGVQGVVIIAHGRSDARAITSAIRVARRMVETDINRHITEEIGALAERT